MRDSESGKVAGSVSAIAYVAVVILVGFAAFAFDQRKQGIFACSAGGYSQVSYLAYCQASNFGDYDHGAFWYGFEPEAVDSARKADVLMLGSSRLQYAMSTQATRQWFQNIGRTTYYLLGFTHSENAAFEGSLVEKLAPKASVIVINADRFFVADQSKPAAAILSGVNGVDRRYRAKRRWQGLHNVICNSVATLCGNGLAIFRNRHTGEFEHWGARPQKSAPVRYESDLVRDTPRAINIAKEFIGSLNVSTDCIILTLVPSLQTDILEVEIMAEQLQVPLILPSLPGLTTFDGSHLDPDSAERWSAEFYEAGSGKILKCLGEKTNALAKTVNPPHEFGG